MLLAVKCELEEKLGDQVNRITLKGTMNVCATCHGNPCPLSPLKMNI